MDYLQNLTLMNLILFALFGLVVGLLINTIDSGSVRGGAIGTTLFGIAGSIVGGLVSTMIFGVSIMGFSVEGILTGVLGGVLLSFLYRILFRDTGHFKTTITNLR